jgi:hypothetical protein
MSQEINLYHEGLRPRRERWRAAHGLWVAGGTLAAAWLLAFALDAVSLRHQAQAQALERLAAAERPLLASVAGSADSGPGRTVRSELDRLRALDAGQRRVQAALQAQAGGRLVGYTPYFMALSRQVQPSLWITGFGVGGDGESLELRGRMVDASALPGYLRQLNGEAQFKGRAFAQLSLKAADAHGEPAAGYTEFVLRSKAASPDAAHGAPDLMLQAQAARAESVR